MKFSLSLGNDLHTQDVKRDEIFDLNDYLKGRQNNNIAILSGMTELKML